MAICVFFFFQAEDGIRDLVRSRGLGDVYKRQAQQHVGASGRMLGNHALKVLVGFFFLFVTMQIDYRILKKVSNCLLYTSDAADERSSVDLGGRRIIKKKQKKKKMMMKARY